jgi:tRNA modification GTPase
MQAEAGTTTVTMLTPTGRGGVAVIAVHGPRGLEFVQRFFQPHRSRPLEERPIHQIVYGRWGAEAGEDVIACRRSASEIEIHCHGGAAAVERIISDLKSAGAISVDWVKLIAGQERSAVRAAARIALAASTTERTATILLDQYQGALERELQRIISQIDETDFGSASAAIARLLTYAPLGLHLTTPWRVVIAGAPNVGKSSLLNALLGYARAIVYHEPGTTRDIVTATTALDGWPIELADTAGWRQSDDPLEAAGAVLAEMQAQAADCLVLVFDASLPWTTENDRLIDWWRPAIVVANKRDLAPCPANNVLATSALTGEGIDRLAEAIVHSLLSNIPANGEGVPFTIEQVNQLTAAAAALSNRDGSSARAILLALCDPR